MARPANPARAPDQPAGGCGGAPGEIWLFRGSTVPLALACLCGPFADALAVTSRCTTSWPPSGPFPTAFPAPPAIPEINSNEQELSKCFPACSAGSSRPGSRPS
jgi:hypothetical protein